MIKKLFSKALLSMVMDKDTRDRLDTRKERKPARKAPTPAPPKAPSVSPPQASPPQASETEGTHRLIMDALRAAEQELTEKQDMTPDRQALIQQALDLQRSKAHVLDDLSQEEREKLYVVALKSLQAEPETGPSSKKTRGKKKVKK
jgi:hypothetical protein